MTTYKKKNSRKMCTSHENVAEVIMRILHHVEIQPSLLWISNLHLGVPVENWTYEHVAAAKADILLDANPAAFGALVSYVEHRLKCDGCFEALVSTVALDEIFNRVRNCA
jgi:hypothetical protein